MRLSLILVYLLHLNLYSSILVVETLSSNIDYGKIYNIKSKQGVYAEPNSFDNNIIMDGWVKNNILNSDFENDIDNWEYDEDADDGTSGATTDDLSGVTHNSKYVWGKSPMASFINLKDFTLKQLCDLPYHMKYGRYNKINLDYGTDDNKDYGRINVTMYKPNGDKTDNWSSPKLYTKNGTLKHYSKIDKFGTKDVASLRIRLGFNNKDGGHIKAFFDNIEISTLEELHFGTQDSDNITYPTEPLRLKMYSWSTKDYGDRQTTSKNLMKPDDIEDFTVDNYIYSSKGNDYIYLPVGTNTYVHTYYGDDTIVAYLGNQISDTTYIDAYKGDDKVYAPIKGNDHDLNGGPGWDTLVMLGNKSDYTITYKGGTEYTIKKSGLKISAFDFEAFSFTTKSPTETVDGNTDEWEDNYIIDEDNNSKLTNNVSIILNNNKEVDGSLVDNYMKAKKIKKTNLKITTDIEQENGKLKIYLLKLPSNVDYALDENNIKWYSETKTNEDGDENTEIILDIKANNTSNLILFSKEEENTNELDLSNMKISRGMI